MNTDKLGVIQALNYEITPFPPKEYLF